MAIRNMFYKSEDEKETQVSAIRVKVIEKKMQKTALDFLDFDLQHPGYSALAYGSPGNGRPVIVVETDRGNRVNYGVKFSAYKDLYRGDIIWAKVNNKRMQDYTVESRGEEYEKDHISYSSGATFLKFFTKKGADGKHQYWAEFSVTDGRKLTLECNQSFYNTKKMANGVLNWHGSVMEDFIIE